MSRTPTTRLVLSKPDPGTNEPYDAAVDLGSNWDKVDGAVGAFECTAATRPTGADAWAGRIISETDTNKMYVREGGAWRQIVVNTGSSVPVDDDVSVTGTLAVSSTFTSGNPVVDQQEFISAGAATWTKPAGAKTVVVECVGGGGAGGGAPATAAGQASAGGGGQSGGYARSVFAASALSATEAVSVGGGGAGVSGSTGSNGTDSTFAAGTGSEVRAAAGNGGTFLAATNTFGVTAIHVTTQTQVGQFVARGGPGGWGLRNGPDSAAAGGAGGNSYFGGGGAPTGNATGQAGERGGGGAGSSNNQSGAVKGGGTGGTGVVIVTTYFD